MLSISHDSALVLMIVSMLLLGTWPSIFKFLQSKRNVPTELANLDFALGALVVSFLFAITAGPS